MTFIAPPGFWTPAEAAEVWSTRRHRVARRTVISWCTRGLIPGVRQMPLATKLRAKTRAGGTFGYVIPRGAVMPVVTRGRPRGATSVRPPRLRR